VNYEHKTKKSVMKIRVTRRMAAGRSRMRIEDCEKDKENKQLETNLLDKQADK